MDLKLSILILTHKRPTLFKRCLNSVINNIPKYVEILVNNDTKDIKEINHEQVSYYYYKNNDLSEIYEFLFKKASGKMIYFLEDDDYVTKNFYSIIKESLFNEQNTIYKYIPYTGIKTYKRFFSEKSFEYNFQIGQMLFRKKDLKKFPKGNNLQNDLEIFKRVQSVNNFIYKDIPIYYQTIDGNDNISFWFLNKDKRFTINEDFK